MSKNIIRLCLAGFFCFFISTLSFADSEKQIFDNGLTAIVTPMPNNPMGSVYGLVKTGSATEGPYLGSGLSHYLEHLLFKGTTTRGVGEIAQTIQNVGGNMNAATSYDYTIYTITVPKNHLDTAIDILSDVLQHATFPAEELEKERQVVFRELQMNNDNPDRYVGILLMKHAYTLHPYQHPVIGYPELCAAVTREHLIDYYKTHYVANNTIVTVAGNVDADQTMEKLKVAFRNYPRDNYQPRNLPKEPQQISARYHEEFHPTDLARLRIAFGTVRLMDEDLFALDVLAKVLGSGKSSRLYESLFKEQQLVHSITSYNYTPFDQGVFVIAATLEDEKVQATLEAIRDEVQNIQSKMPSKSLTSKELEKAKKQVVSDYVFGRQKTSDIAHGQALDEAFTGDYDFSKKYVEGIKRVTEADIRRVANQYLNPHHQTTVVLRPEKAKQELTEDDQKTNPETIDRLTLNNGIRVLLRPDDTVPAVAMQISMNGGLLYETEETAGLSQLTAQTWVKATRKQNSKKLAEYVESKGMRLSGFSGRNSLGIRLEALAEDASDGLDLLQDVLLEPAFNEEDLEDVERLLKVAIRQRDDNIFKFSGREIRKQLFPNHPYGRPPEGTYETLSFIDRSVVEDFYQKVLKPKNIVISVFGDFDYKEVKERIAKLFGGLKASDFEMVSYPVSDIEQQHHHEIRMDKEQAMVLIGFHAPDMHDKDRYTAELMTAVLGSSFKGRLFQVVREENGLAYTVGGQYTPGFGKGTILFYALTQPETADDVKQMILSEVQNLAVNPIPDQELDEFRNFLKGQNQSSQQTNTDLSFISSLDELYGLGFDDYLRYDSHMDAVTAQDIQTLAQEYLNSNQAVSVITLPRFYREKTSE